MSRLFFVFQKDFSLTGIPGARENAESRRHADAKTAPLAKGGGLKITSEITPYTVVQETENDRVARRLPDGSR